jgi:hypothetical protein
MLPWRWRCRQAQAASVEGVEGARVCRGRPSSLKRSASTHPTALLTLPPCHGHEPTTQPTGCLQDRLGRLLRSHPLSRATSSRILPPSFTAPTPSLAPFRSFDFISAPRLCRSCSLHAHHCRSFTSATLFATLTPFSLPTPFHSLHSKNRLSYSLGLWYISLNIPTSSAYTHVANANPNPPQTPISVLLYPRRTGSHAVHRLTLLYMSRMSASL